MDEIGSIIDAVAVAGGDLARIDNIGFTVDEPSDYYEEAREDAIAEAKAKAEQLAQLAGIKLGKPTYISEGGSGYAPIYRQDAYMEESIAPTPISVGEMEVSLTVQIAYAIDK